MESVKRKRKVRVRAASKMKKLRNDFIKFLLIDVAAILMITKYISKDIATKYVIIRFVMLSFSYCAIGFKYVFKSFARLKIVRREYIDIHGEDDDDDEYIDGTVLKNLLGCTGMIFEICAVSMLELKILTFFRNNLADTMVKGNIIVSFALVSASVYLVRAYILDKYNMG